MKKYLIVYTYTDYDHYINYDSDKSEIIAYIPKFDNATIEAKNIEEAVKEFYFKYATEFVITNIIELGE